MSALENRDPDTGRLRPPQLRPVVPFVCDAGVTPCGEPARLFPGGWFCQQHKPGTKTS
ncbi:hypothetical protein [Streptomyces sp. B1I3]|uniref:hypothetical protein n=1 Tax=Streptomyces sp. B1I3 TaxID=3042264 RepID=UPI00277FAA12|nr:hypothetical protein [Streptomyces sp. B1I3]MDQ0792041.1 hypothetical protein [Streptomyces sp. B1I3]